MTAQQRILDTSFNLIMKYGIKSVSMDDIARETGMSKKTIYQYFENKKKLIQNVVINHINDDEKIVSGIVDNSEDAIDEIVAIARHVLNFMKGMSPSMLFDLKKYYKSIWETIQGTHFKFIYQVIRNNIDRGQSEGYYNKDLDSDIIAKLFLHQILAISDESMYPSSTYHRYDIYKNFITYHIRGLMSSQGRVKAKNLELN